MPDPTIYDVAQAADVATSTVSRAFSNPQRVSTRTRERVLAVASELGYRPNPHARALLSGRHHTIAMVVSDITNPHYFELIRGAELRAKASEFTLVLVNAEESPRIEARSVTTGSFRHASLSRKSMISSTTRRCAISALRARPHQAKAAAGP